MSEPTNDALQEGRKKQLDDFNQMRTRLMRWVFTAGVPVFTWLLISSLKPNDSAFIEWLVLGVPCAMVFLALEAWLVSIDGSYRRSPGSKALMSAAVISCVIGLAGIAGHFVALAG